MNHDTESCSNYRRRDRHRQIDGNASRQQGDQDGHQRQGEAVGQKAIEEIRAQGGDAAFIAVDVDNETQVSQMIGFAVKKYGRLDLAVNNAGISNETKTIGDSDPAKFQAMLQTNVMGVYLCMKYEI